MDRKFLAKHAHIFLDAWAFIDAADRFRSLWEMQPNSEKIPKPYSPFCIKSQLQGIRDLRNVSVHIAQKIDQIVALNSSILGSISWLTLASQQPLKIKTCFIRPGVAIGTISEKFALGSGDTHFVNGSGCITMAAGSHKFILSNGYELIQKIVKFAEHHLDEIFQNPALSQRLPGDVFGIAELNIGTPN